MTLERITAPYGFVPLSSTIVFPSWLQPRAGGDGDAPRVPPLHDVPFRDGISGTLELEIHAETPIFVRGASGDPSQPFQLPDGTYALPGTAVRGALRNVLEIATFGRFQRVNRNHRYAVRDLTRGGEHIYRQFMAAIIGSELTPLVNAGWLSQQGEGEEPKKWTLEVCDFGKIEYKHLQEIAEQREIRGFQPGKKQSSVAKYKNWRTDDLEVQLHLNERVRSMPGRLFPSAYGIALPGASTRAGTLVFTGQPQNREAWEKKKKHHDFVFFAATQPKTFEVDRKVFENFEFAHSDRGQQNSLSRSPDPNEEWGHWKPILEKGGRVPVFFLADSTGVTDFGLAMMFRMPYKHSIGDAVDHANPEHGNPDAGLDFAEGLFGTARSGREGAGRRRHGVLALKGRVGISHAVAQGEVQPGPAVSAILGAPKASYYPNYVEQKPDAPGSPPPRGGPYKTWNDPDCVPRGWKRYRPLTVTQSLQSPSNGEPRVATTFCPLPKGTRFQAHVDLHNLRPVELGALLWILDFGSDRAARHTLGLARPLGYGRVRLQVEAEALFHNAGETVDPAACVQAFETWMEEQVKGWRQTPQIRELLALSHPVDPKEARYQKLSPGRDNEFVLAKNNFLALPSAAGLGHRGEGDKPSAGRPGQGGQHFGTSRPGQWGPGIGKPASPGPAKKPGDLIEVELRDLSKKGKWTCTAPEIPGSKGTIQGDPSSDAAAGQRHQVKVIQPITVITNMVLEWPK